MMLADARTLCPAIATAPSDPAGDLAFLEQLALWAQRWGPWSALDAPDGLLVDVTAVPHLFGGETLLLEDVREAFARRRLAVRMAIAPTAGAAWALAHHAPDGTIVEHHDDIERALSDLPVAALRLDQDVVTVLRRLGLKRLGDITTIGRDALQRRFRNRKSPAANPLIRRDQLLGRVPEPLLPVIAQQVPLVQRRLMEPIRHRQLLDQVVADLAQDMARELEGQGQGARRLELGLWRVDGEVVVRRLEMAAATRDPAHMLRLFAARLDDIDAGFGIEMVRLRASWAEPLALAQGDIESAAEDHGTSLAACIDRLTVRLGAQAISRPVPFASHIPERAQRWRKPLEPEPSRRGNWRSMRARSSCSTARRRSPCSTQRPTAIRNASAGGARCTRSSGSRPERIAPEWWRERGGARLRDYYRIEDGQGRRYWIYRQGIIGDGRGGAPDWYLQGLCA